MIATSCLLLPPPPPTPSLPCTGSFIFSFTPPPDGLVMSTSTSHTARRELSTVLNQLTLPERFRYESGLHPSTTSISESARGQIGGKILFRNDHQTRSRFEQRVQDLSSRFAESMSRNPLNVVQHQVLDQRISLHVQRGVEYQEERCTCESDLQHRLLSLVGESVNVLMRLPPFGRSPGVKVYWRIAGSTAGGGQTDLELVLVTAGGETIVLAVLEGKTGRSLTIQDWNKINSVVENNEVFVDPGSGLQSDVRVRDGEGRWLDFGHPDGLNVHRSELLVQVGQASFSLLVAQPD